MPLQIDSGSGTNQPRSLQYYTGSLPIKQFDFLKHSRAMKLNNVPSLPLPESLDWQQAVMDEAERFNAVNVGRRAGKTTLGEILCADKSTLPYPVGWFSPTYKMLIDVWRNALDAFAPIISRKNATERRIEFVTGGLIEFWSLENPDSVRGRRYKRVIVDEAAMVPSLMDVWNFVLRPTLADWLGDAWFLSTPKGRNGFWQLWQMGQDDAMPDWMSWQMPSTVNPKVPASEFEAMRLAMPERIYAQEILAQFLEDAGGVFRNVMACAVATPSDERRGDKTYIIGADWGKHNDFTVFTVIDAQARRMVAMDRFNQIDYQIQVSRLQVLAERYGAAAIIAERNSMGEPLIEQLQRSGLPVMPFTTTNATKTTVIDALALAFERSEIEILNDTVLINELQSYEMERLPSGMMRYSAPEGMHDDTVMSLALAWHGCQMSARPRMRMRGFG